jgi:isoquinoline 1-oxidoreductase subunit beta
MTKTSLSRRDALKAAGGLTFAFSFGLSADDASAQKTAAPAAASKLNAYVSIAGDGIITIQSPAPEMGQGIKTGIPLIIAEELDADWSKVRVVQSPIDPAYDHPIFRSQFVVGSLSTRGYWMPVRTAGAQARRVLLDAAAAKWNVPVGELSTEPGVVVHKASNRRLGYGEIAATAKAPDKLPEIKPEDLKKVAAFRLLGKDVARGDVPAKATGREQYSIDVQVPGMLFGTLARAPVRGSGPVSFNEADLAKMPGVVKVVALSNGVGIVGQSMPQVIAARRALKAQWKDAPGSKTNSVEALKEYQAAVRNAEKKGVVGRNSGDIAKAMAEAAKTVTGEYTTDYVYHAQMEPLNAVASVTADGVEVWAGTQWPTMAMTKAAEAAGVPREKVKFNPMTMGGGFGRRAYVEYVVDAVALSKAAGKPVKMVQTREDDVAAARVRPMTAHKIDVGLDKDGKILGWRHRIAADTVVPYLYGPARMETQKGVDHIVMAGADVPLYDVQSHQAEHLYEERGVRTAAWRGIGAGHNAFAIECMIDRLAKETGVNPIAYRIGLLKDRRAKDVIHTVAEMSDWYNKKARPGRSVGVAFSRLGLPQVGEALAATVAECSVDQASGLVRVHKLWCAADVGLPLQPANIAAQVEGSLIWGVSSALKERITIKDGAVQQQNFSDYEILRMSETPEVNVKVLRSGEMPLPVGELGLGTVIPAIANAIFAGTGKWLTAAPFTKTRVTTALKA